MKKSVLSIFSVLLFTALLFVQCEKDDPIPEPEPKPETDYMVYENGSGEIGEAGGEIKVNSSSSAINGAFVKIESGILDKNTQITIKESSEKLNYNGQDIT